MIKIGALGSIVKGHVLDVKKAHITEALVSYDPLLYVTWNPKKRKGEGIWEVRRRPEKNSILDLFVYAGNTYVKVGPKENNLVHHVMDAPILDFRIMKRVKEMDVWSKTNKHYFAAQVDSNLDSYDAQKKAKARAHMLDKAKEYKHELKDLRELVNSGFNPHRLMDYWGKKGS